MTNTYRALSDYGKAIWGEGTFEAEFTALDERDHLSGKHLEIVPRKYKVLSDNFSAGKQGDPIEAAFTVEIEAMLSGVHVERVEPAKTKPEPKK